MSSSNRTSLAAGLLLLFFSASLLSHAASRLLSRNENHEQWMARYGRKYKDADEKERRSKIFQENVQYENVTAVPSSMDWRKKGAVTPIKDQGQCGLATENNYPYKGVDGTCNSNEASNHAATITGHEDVPANSESALLKAVASQPVSVAIDASGSDFQFYSSGVFTGDCGTELDHGVTAVGYGTSDDGTKYWLVKNSWGTSWGQVGYILMQRDVEAKEGLCGIAMQASYPTA
ncbi:hypothetical protein L1987_72706 [Smallanthus sonchifolius]|uniref:Uncharacterized protein n=1 Tax=Smallanthus sonchifolius TaxID=185202 RepID=A0ACB9AXA1_9ASTR|nr:hypothetical protein L1987_72706 [Smallanthus sonchifolius]